MFCLGAFLALILTAPGYAAENAGAAGSKKLLIFSMPPEGYPPFLIQGPDGSTSGIMLDVLSRLSSHQGYTIRQEYYPEIREGTMVEQGKIDARAKAREWVKDPDRFTWSDPITECTDVLVFLKTKPLIFRDLDDLTDKKIIAHLGYTYPVLDPLFSSNKIRRFDEYNETAMLDSLLKAEHDAAVMNKQVALWLIKNNKKYQGKFRFSEKIIDTVGYRIMFTNKKNWGGFADRFNKDLAK